MRKSADQQTADVHRFGKLEGRVKNHEYVYSVLQAWNKEEHFSSKDPQTKSTSTLGSKKELA